MGVFEEVFAARASTEEATQPAEGVFEEVFVVRGRWRNKTPAAVSSERPRSQDSTDISESDIVDPLSQTIAPETTDVSNLIVKNGFYEEVFDYDSLKDFLLERKVQSCPVDSLNLDVTSSMPNMDFEADSIAVEDMLKTASNYGDIDPPCLLAQQQIFRTGSSYGDQDAPLTDVCPEEGFKTGSDFGDLGVPLATADGSHGTQIHMPQLLNRALPLVQSNSSDDMLTSLRQKGSAIHETILRSKGADLRRNVVDLQAAAVVARPLDASPAVPWYESSCRSLQQSLLLPPPPPPDVAPVNAAVLRLAEAVAPPELGTPALPSIGSLLHYKRECKPCTFFHTRGCENKEDCQYCHLCGPGEKKKRLRAQRAAKRDAKAAALENARAILAAYSAAEECDDCDMIIE